MSLIYRIEDDPREDSPCYDKAGLPACKARARRLSAKPVDGWPRTVYIIASRGHGALHDCGQIVFTAGCQEYVEGEV
jgi:hypothetical protein